MVKKQKKIQKQMIKPLNIIHKKIIRIITIQLTIQVIIQVAIQVIIQIATQVTHYSSLLPDYTDELNEILDRDDKQIINLRYKFYT